MKKYAWILIFCLLQAHASDLDRAYARGEKFGESQEGSAYQAILDLNVKDVPGYEGDDPWQTGIDENSIENAAQAAIASNPHLSAAYEIAQDVQENPYELDEEHWEKMAEIMRERAQDIIGDEGFCIDGECYTWENLPNQDIHEPGTILSDLIEAGENMTSSMTIYNGSKEKCKKDSWGFADCCKDKGWLVDWNLTQCPQEYKILGMKKEKGLCHYVGDYTESDWIGNKTKYKVYCCFETSLARITHEQGRGQVGLDWGKPKRANCRGFTVDEFENLDYSKMDMSEWYGELDSRVQEVDESDIVSAPDRFYESQAMRIETW